MTFKQLRPIWRKYYKKRRHETRISLWNRFLHWGYTVLFRYRLWKRIRHGGD